MENEKKENKGVINLTDEELKDVTGGGLIEDIMKMTCTNYNEKRCDTIHYCKWYNGKCVYKL